MTSFFLGVYGDSEESFVKGCEQCNESRCCLGLNRPICPVLCPYCTRACTHTHTDLLPSHLCTHQLFIRASCILSLRASRLAFIPQTTGTCPARLPGCLRVCSGALRASLRPVRGAGPAGIARGRSEMPSGSPSWPPESAGTARFALDPIGSPRPTKLPDCAAAHLGPQHSWSVVWLRRGRACGPPLTLPQPTQGGHFGRP